MKKIIIILKDKTGSSFFAGAFIALSFLVVACICFEFFHLHIVSLGIRDSVQSAITTTCTENYDKLYNGLREGYSGGYQLYKNHWSENIDTGNIYLQLDKLLGTKVEGEKHIKYSNNKVSYILSDLTVQMTNTPFAPNGHNNTEKFTGVAYINLTVPFGFGWGNLPPMTAKIKVTAGYTPKF